tara:strand:+ start:167 stop:301 length:135 start_codon:yes stop_codon:yes gene_type:complete
MTGYIALEERESELFEFLKRMTELNRDVRAVGTAHDQPTEEQLL